MSLYGAMDLGTNSIRLLLAKVEEGKVMPLLADLKTTRLGEGMHQQSRLTPESIERTLEGIRNWARLLQEYTLQGLAIVATSAVRQAENGGELVARIKEETGWQVQVIPGAEEARLSYRGAVAGVPSVFHPLIVDVGGGSTELVLAPPEKEMLAVSVPIGAVRLTGQGWTRAGIVAALEPVLPAFQALGPRDMVAVGGTATSLAAMEQKLEQYDAQKVHGFSLARNQVESWLERLTGLAVEGRRGLPGLQPQRADIIDAGVAILTVIMEKLSLERMIVSEWDLLHGLIMDLAGNSFSGKSS